ncbi:MAG: tetratricopeptide repeat protein [Verrucomicrobiota bacterium]
MTTETRDDPRKNFIPCFLPWLLAAAALAFYWLTLNRWASLFNLEAVAKISGWTWQPELVNPLLFLVTYPFRWLPTTQVPIAVNVFSAVCAAATLGLLARSVVLLPHDRTDAQRRRERSDFSFLTVGSAWLPPVLAVAVCGLQLTFWEHATNFTGEMFGLLLFAFVIWSLLEYRLDEREGRLYLAAAVYGAGMVENWAMVGFLPVFIAAIIWIRGLSFFNLRFLQWMVLCGLAGMSLALLLPTWAVVSGKIPGTFWWLVLKSSLALQYNVLKLCFLSCIHPQQYFEFLSLLLAYLMPVFVLAIRWQSSFGDSSRMGMALASFMFHLVHAVILFICVWLVFDPPFSPREKGFGLTFYYLITLSVGYYSGYFLLVFGQKAFSRSQPPPPAPFQFLNPFVVAGVFVLAALAITGLVYKNTPRVRDVNDNTLSQYASLLEENLPRGGGFLLSDDPLHLSLVQAALARDGRAKEFVPLDTKFLVVPAYHRFLHREFPQKWPELVSATQNNALHPLGLIGVLNLLSKTNELYYLHPSFGYYFEQFYLEPRGLVYKLKPLPDDTLLPPPLDQNQIAENEAFWSRVEAHAFPSIERQITPPEPNTPKTLGQRLLARLHVVRDQNPNAVVAGTFYSRDLNFWGVQLQRAGNLERAADYFEMAQKLNPDNVVAQVNLQFNQDLRAGRTVPVDPAKVTRDQFGKYHDWNEVINASGPFDEPSFCFANGVLLARGNGYFRQAVASFNRVRELNPNYLPARLLLAQIYLSSRLPDRALEVLHDPLTQPQKFSLTDSNSTELNVLAAGAYLQETNFAQGTRLLELEISRHPDNNYLLTATVQAFVMRGLFTNALAVIDHKLKMVPDDPTGLFGKGYVCIQVHAYDDAVAAFTRVLAIQTNNTDARFNRALAYLDSGKLDAARADYRQFQQTFTNSFPAAYGLGEIAWRKHETNEAIRNYKIYLANANTNTAEATNVILRLRELEGHSP